MCECCSNSAKRHESHLHVDGVNCGHCVATIQKALADMPGINGVEHLKDRKQLRIDFDNRLVEVENLKATIVNLGYSVA